MRLKTKLYSVIMAFCLMLSLLAVGVWAVNTGTVNIGGTVSFIATDIYATITGKVEGATSTPTLSTLNYSATSTPTQDELNTWSRDLEFAKTTTPTIKWTVTIQNKSERVLYVSLTDNMTSITNVTKSMTYDGATYTSGEKAIPANTTKIFTMTAVVNDTNKKASAVYDYAFDLRDANSDLAPDQGEEGGSNVDLKWDADNEYWYVTMGSTDTLDEIKWRLVGVEGERYTSTTKPTSGTGTFILETNLSKNKGFGSVDWGTYAGNNDYSTGYIREYLTGNSSYALDWEGNTVNTDNGSFLTDFNIAEDDAVYSAITAREITDLHNDIGWARGNVGGGQQYAPPTGTTTNATYDTTPKTSVGADKLWLMSVAEIYTMVGGGTIGADGTIPNDWSTYYDNLIWNEVSYWLRSPSPNDSLNAFYVGNTGVCYETFMASSYAVRPAFNLALGGSTGGGEEDDTPVNAEDVPYLAFTVINENEKSVEVSLDRSASVPSDLVIPSYVIMYEKQYTVTSIPDADYDSGQALQGVSCNSLTLPNSLKYIGSFAFYAASINNLYIGSNIEYIAPGSYINHAVKNYNTYENGKYLGSETHPYIVLVSVESSNIVSAKIHDDCKIIFSNPVGGGTGVFQGCSSLEEVVLPNNLSQIGVYAFSGCTSLASITIPDSVTSVEWGAFDGCSNLAEVNVKATSVPTGGYDMFSNCSSSLVIYVPTSSVSAYQTAEYWSNYSNQIQGKDF